MTLGNASRDVDAPGLQEDIARSRIDASSIVSMIKDENLVIRGLWDGKEDLND